MSRIAICDSVSTIFCSSDSITIWVRAESSVPIIGSAKNAVPQLHHRRRQLEELLLLAVDDLLARALRGLHGVQAELVEQHRHAPRIVGEALRVAERFLLERLEQRFLERKDEARRLVGGESREHTLARELLEKVRAPPPIRRR